MKEKTLGIIGYGRFGKLIYKYLKKDFKIIIYDKNIKEKSTEETLKKVTRSNIVIFAVPISELENTLKKIKQHIKQKTLFIDVCSVKEYPVKLMKKHLPKNVEVLATHPMFGPDSAKTILEGRKIVICPIRVNSKTLNKTKNYLKEKGLKIIEMKPNEHDKITAKTQLLAHYISRTLIELNIKKTNIDTEGFKSLQKITKIVKKDNIQLFKDMNKYNKYSNNMRKSLIKKLIKINNDLEHTKGKK